MSLQSFGGAQFLLGNRTRRSLSAYLLTSPRCSAAIDLSTVLPFFHIGAVVTGMVLPFCTMVVYCCNGSMLAPDAAIIAMLGHTCRYESVGVGLGARAGRGA